MKNNRENFRKLVAKIQKSVNTTAGTGGDFLPEPLAMEFINFVREKSFLRQLFRTVRMTSKTRDIPKILSGGKVYYQPNEGETVTSDRNRVNTGTLRLNAKKFMTEILLTEEVMEDAQQDMESIIQSVFSEAVSEAEEISFIQGNTQNATTNTESSESENTWFVLDPRLAFDGLVTLSSDISGQFGAGNRAADRVNAEGNEMASLFIRTALHNLGKYGKAWDNIVTILNPWSGNQLLDDPKLVTIDKYGSNATIVTGEFGKLYGKSRVIVSGHVPEGYGVVTPIANPIIGDRRALKIKRQELVRNDSIVIVFSERIDMVVQYKEALCQIHNLEHSSDYS
jgi:hypothetical protein